VTTLLGAGTKNEATQPRRTASSVTKVIATNGTSGGSNLREKVRALM
jgi:hypothetical protein